MDDTEAQSASRLGITRTSQACQRCRSLKTRCLQGPQPGICQRCSGSGKDCIWAEAPRRARKLRAPSRISQVEQKIDGLVAKLVNPPDTRPVSVPGESSHTAPPEGRSRGSGGVASWPEAWRKEGTHAPGSWIPVPSSFEPINPEAEDSPTQVTPDPATMVPLRDDDEDDRQYVDRIRTIHTFGDAEEVSQAPEGLFLPSKRREAPIVDEVVQQLLASREADTLLETYRQMSASFPFVIVPAEVTAQALHNEKPMLLLVILIAASSKEHGRQMQLDTVFRKELAHRTIIQPRRTLGLVQSVLVYLSWYHFVFSHKTQQIFFLHHLVIGLALDIGLHRDYQPLNFPHRPKPTPITPQERRERERAFLGCYYLSSMISAGLQKPNLLKHTSYMNEWAQNLKSEREYDSDETINHLITLRQLDDQVQDTLYSTSAVDLPLSDARTLMHVRFLEGQLNAWKRDSQDAGEQRLLTLSSSFTDMLLHNVALRHSKSGGPGTGVDSTQLNSLLEALEAGKRFLDALLSYPMEEYHLVSFSEWMRLPTVIMTVARLCIPSEAHTAIGWDSKAAQERVRLDLCLEALCYRMQQLSTYDKAKRSTFDFWFAMRFINDLTKTWYMRKIKPQASTKHMQAGGVGSIGSTASTTAMATPSSDQCLSGIGIGSADMHLGGENGSDPFAFMKDMDFDFDSFFDMDINIWGDEAYTGMGFGGGMPF